MAGHFLQCLANHQPRLRTDRYNGLGRGRPVRGSQHDLGSCQHCLQYTLGSATFALQVEMGPDPNIIEPGPGDQNRRAAEWANSLLPLCKIARLEAFAFVLYTYRVYRAQSPGT
jgi:hypothetical protein